MRTPIIIVNFKTYEEVLFPNVLELVKVCELVAKESGRSIAIAPQTTELALISVETGIPVLAQHVDNVSTGSNTGHTSPQAVKACGAVGTLINHSEYKIPHEDVKTIIEKCKGIGLVSVACADDIGEVKSLARFNPDFLAVEPPELIGGDISVTTANPDIVKGAVDAVKSINPDIKVLCGAGVKTKDDVKMAIQLGTEGVLLASGVVKSKDPKGALGELADGLP
ncbi:MAG: triose-phosphate isomerase [Thermoplasmata archaeon]|nr:triose-phosphate isomerase [Thermoplasmata archaeon]